MTRHRMLPPVCAAVLATLFAAGCSTRAENQGAAPPPPVEVTQVAATDVPIYVEYPAQTYARNMVEVRGRVEGYIEKWLFKPGDEVREGQPLYVLDLRPYEAAVQQANGNLKQTEADLDYARQQVSLLQAQANLAVAQASLVKAHQDYDRLKPLVEQDAAAKQDLDTATTALTAAEANVRANQANVDQARIQTATQIQSTEGKVEAQRGLLATANLNVQYGTIQAPIAGLVGDTLIPVGGLVTPSAAQPLTTIVPLDPMWVRFKISESQYLAYKRRLHDQAPLELLLADETTFPQRGHIENTVNQVDPKTGTLELQANFPNPQHTLLPGQFGRVRFQTEDRKNAILVPQRAVQQIQSLQTVYVVGPDNVAQARPITTGDRSGESWIVTSGLQPGDRVVVEGQLRLRPGMLVHPIPYRGAGR
ncbi:MAG: efflux RND transporter periplasmic adaptor subunit [Bryobacteraceae bacterium]